MKILTAAWCAALFSSLPLPASAQSVPIYAVERPGPRCWLCYPPAQTPQLLAKETAGEDPAVTNVAHGLYAKIAGGSIAGYRLTTELQNLWTPSLEAKAGAQLESLGNPSWSFAGNAITSAGSVSVYRLTYENSRPIYMSVGVADNGVVYDLRLADSVATAAPSP